MDNINYDMISMHIEDAKNVILDFFRDTIKDLLEEDRQDNWEKLFRIRPHDYNIDRFHSVLPVTIIGKGLIPSSLCPLDFNSKDDICWNSEKVTFSPAILKRFTYDVCTCYSETAQKVCDIYNDCLNKITAELKERGWELAKAETKEFLESLREPTFELRKIKKADEPEVSYLVRVTQKFVCSHFHNFMVIAVNKYYNSSNTSKDDGTPFKLPTLYLNNSEWMNLLRTATPRGELFKARAWIFKESLRELNEVWNPAGWTLEYQVNNDFLFDINLETLVLKKICAHVFAVKYLNDGTMIRTPIE